MRAAPSRLASLLLLLCACGGGTGSDPAGDTLKNKSQNRIKHIFIIFKENHTYDNYFATWPGGDGASIATRSDGSRIALAEPWSDYWYPGSNSWDAAHQDFAGGAMNGFDLGELTPGVNLLSHGPYVTWAPADGKPGGPARYYWQLAQAGVLCDHYFTSVMGPSLPNHLMSVAATSGRVIGNPGILNHLVPVLDANGKVVDHAESFSASEIATTLPNELEAKGLTWKYYGESSSNPLGSIADTLEDQGIGAGMIDVLRNLPGYATGHDDTTKDLDQNMGAVLAAGNVANVTWIRPNALNSEHALISGVEEGANWTRKVVNAIAQSDVWGDSAIFVTYDDYGGFYDHVPPPQVDEFGLGFRVPLTIVSPYAKKGAMLHDTYEVSAILKFAESTFGLPAMTNRDAGANDLSGAFDFTQQPRPPGDFVF